MALKLLLPPAFEPITREEAKLHLKVDVNTDDNLIDALITAAREYCEGFQNRAYITQTWELWLDKFPNDGVIKIPRPPLQSIDSVVYYDTDDHEHTFEGYFVDDKSEPGRLVLGYGQTWPSANLRRANAVCITFTAGYDATDYEGEGIVPQKVKQAMLLLVGAWYENREAFTSHGGIPKEIPFAVKSLLWLDRVL